MLVPVVAWPSYAVSRRWAARAADLCCATSVLVYYLVMMLDKAMSGTGVPSAIEFRLDPTSGVPTYLQIVQQVEHALRLGYLKPGDQLPKVREVVAGLAINPNTVLKAYRDLEYKGLASGRPGRGTFIDASLGDATLPVLADLRSGLRKWLAKADAAGLDEDGIVALVTSTLRDFSERSDPDAARADGTQRPGTKAAIA